METDNYILFNCRDVEFVEGRIFLKQKGKSPRPLPFDGLRVPSNVEGRLHGV